MLKVTNLRKEYPNFKLKDISFSLPSGVIMGFIGMNGAGKTTTMKSILNLVKPDGGSVEIFGKNIIGNEVEIKKNIGFMLGKPEYYPRSTVKKVVGIYKTFFNNWNEEVYISLIKKFSIDENKKLCELSCGMGVKLGIAMALSHDAKLLIFDEPTSGLDPIARDELQEIFRSVVSDGEKSILFSTHITSDLDKCADYIIFIRNGELVADETKDDLILSHTLVCGKKSDFTSQLQEDLIGYKENSFGFTALMKSDKAKNYPSLEKEVPNLEDIMVYYNTHAKENVL